MGVRISDCGDYHGRMCWCARELSWMCSHQCPCSNRLVFVFVGGCVNIRIHCVSFHVRVCVHVCLRVPIRDRMCVRSLSCVCARVRALRVNSCACVRVLAFVFRV